VARDLRESTKIFAQANEQRNSIRRTFLFSILCPSSHVILSHIRSSAPPRSFAPSTGTPWRLKSTAE
jgi:hypothetical protein